MAKLFNDCSIICKTRMTQSAETHCECVRLLVQKGPIIDPACKLMQAEHCIDKDSDCFMNAKRKRTKSFAIGSDIVYHSGTSSKYFSGKERAKKMHSIGATKRKADIDSNNLVPSNTSTQNANLLNVVDEKSQRNDDNTQQAAPNSESDYGITLDKGAIKNSTSIRKKCEETKNKRQRLDVNINLPARTSAYVCKLRMGLAEIPRGMVWTFSGLARQIGSSPRLVASEVRRLRRIGKEDPCKAVPGVHRVVASTGKLDEISPLGSQSTLLRCEGVEFDAQGHVSRRCMKS